MIDTKMLKAGQEFKKIQDSYVIFITAENVIGAGCSLYYIYRIKAVNFDKRNIYLKECVWGTVA